MEDSSSAQESALPTTSTPAELTSLEQLDKEQIRKAVEALLTHSKSRKNKNGLLLNENENLFLMVVLWKIPGKELRVRLSLPHGIRSDLSEICLFTKDELQSPEQTERFYRKLLNKHGIKTISRIIPFRTLKTEYKAYEAKLQLLNSFDFFLTDERIRRLLPSHIGRHFYQRKKVPVSVNLLAKNLSEEINNSLGGTVLNISKSGSCSAVRIGHTGMQAQDVTENIVAVAESLSKKLPEKWESVKLLFVKTGKSVSLPIFSSFISYRNENSKMVIRKLKEKEAKKKEKEQKLREKRKLKREKKKLKEKAKKATSAVTKGSVAPKTKGASVKSRGSQKKKTGKVKAQVKVTNESDDEIPQLVPIVETPVKENVEVQKHVPGKKSPKKSPAPNTPQGKKRKALPAAEAPGAGPGKKPKMGQKKKQRKSSPGKKDLRQTPKKPEAKLFIPANKSAKKAPHTPKQLPKESKVPQST
ncbi:PREDICTED: ribosomal L1 domain-containing protein 1 [Chinchilla lanigera]|uniref:Ribosomal L1 domain-containing protein 1 n=1 Tax=Chinchilla lanigera TaxID=34839 RepID=A0A8C2VI45_CHILA|nr:PREDICTED: ribosomal L1 domain-containing protein 1 [Chinchilla lanigera]